MQITEAAYFELLTAYQAALDLLETEYADCAYSFDIREQLIDAFAAADRDIPDRYGEGLPRNAEQLAEYQSADA